MSLRLSTRADPGLLAASGVAPLVWPTSGAAPATAQEFDYDLLGRVHHHDMRDVTMILSSGMALMAATASACVGTCVPASKLIPMTSNLQGT